MISNKPVSWVPTLYFAEALPYMAVMTLSVIMYTNMGLTNTELALYTSWLYLPWVIKPLWSPLIDAAKTKRWWILAMQILIGASLAGVALTLQTAINRLGQDIIVAHTAARKISEIFMVMFTVFGQTMATFCGQNIGAGEVARVKKGIKLAIFYTCIWCTMAIIASYTIGPWLVKLVTGTNNPIVIKNATNYLKFDTLFYYVTAVICIVRNAMQGLGEQITPLVSSSLEMVGKIVIAFTLVPLLGYTGVIVAEPIVWFIMVIPLLVKIYTMPVLRKQPVSVSLKN